MPLRPFTSRLLIVWMLLIASQVAADSDSFRSPGPYPVGVTTTVFVDHARIDPATNGPRTLLTEIWYPATDDARDLPKNRFSDFLLRGTHPGLSLALQLGFKVKVDELDQRFENLSVRDARVRDGKFPLIVFSHGNGGIRNQSTFWCDFMASHGYIVVSPDHTGNSAVTVVNGKLVPGKGDLRATSAEDRPKDVSFLIDSMARLDRGEDSRFTGRIDLKAIGAAGHSFGGYTAGKVINTDNRIKAIIALSPVFAERTNYTTPVLTILGTEDDTIGLEGNEKAREFYRQTKGARMLVEILDGGHYTFSDMFQLKPDFGDGIGKGTRITKPGEPLEYLGMKESYEIINYYSGLFFEVFVKGDRAYEKDLPTNIYPELLVVEYHGESASDGDMGTAAGQ